MNIKVTEKETNFLKVKNFETEKYLIKIRYPKDAINEIDTEILPKDFEKSVIKDLTVETEKINDKISFSFSFNNQFFGENEIDGFMEEMKNIKEIFENIKEFI